MADIFSPAKRSEVMARVRARDTRPELIVRSYLHRRGLRFRLHRRDLPGCPDIVLPVYRVAILVHGCFWHGHTDCKRATLPKARASFWAEKIAANRERDARTTRALEALGWRPLIVWECEIGSASLAALYQAITLQPMQDRDANADHG